jgi:hypothetical protein
MKRRLRFWLHSLPDCTAVLLPGGGRAGQALSDLKGNDCGAQRNVDQAALSQNQPPHELYQLEAIKLRYLIWLCFKNHTSEIDRYVC